MEKESPRDGRLFCYHDYMKSRPARIILVVLGIIIAAPFAALFIFGLIYESDPLHYAALKIHTMRTPDTLIHAHSCGEVRLEIWQSDEARLGYGLGLGSPPEPARVEEPLFLKAFVNNDTIFALRDNYPEEPPRGGAIWVEPRYSDPPSEKKFFVFDKEGFAGAGDYYSQDPNAVLVAVSSESGISEQEVETVARCYAEDRGALNESWQELIVAFSYIALNDRKAAAFSCPDGRNVHATEAGDILVEGGEGGSLGKILADGTFRPFQSNHLNEDGRNIANWLSCSTSDGMTLERYMDQYQSHTVYIEPA